MRFRLLLIAGLLPAAAGAQATARVISDHRWIVEQFFLARSWPDKARYYTGEMTTYAQALTMGEAGAPVRPGSVRVISLTGSQAVYTVQVGDTVRLEDWYAYVVKGAGGWRLAAVRTLALPPLFFMAMDTLSAAKPLPDSLAGVLENMRLTASSDSVLMDFFRARRDEIQRIGDGFSRETVGSIAAAPDGLEAPTASLRSLAEALAALHFRGAWRDPEVAGCIFVEIGGMIDNEVGFMRCASEASVPPITPERFILIEPISNGWYLYKTT